MRGRRAALGRARWSVPAVVLLALVACDPASRDPIGELVHDVVAHRAGQYRDTDSLIFIIVDPAQCSVCNNEISRARDWADASPRRQFHLLLSRPPNRSEQNVIIRYRLTVDTIVDRARVTRTGPALVMMVGDQEVLRAQGQRGIGALFDDDLLTVSETSRN